MLEQRTMWGVMVALVLGGASAFSQGLGTGPAAADENLVVIERILVKVNGDIITQTDMEKRQIDEIRRRGIRPSTNAELARIVNEITPGLIVAAVDEKLLVQRGRELGYQLSDEQFENILENLREENGFADNVELAVALEESEGLTIADLRRLMESQMLVNQVQQIEILNKVRITDVEAREYYEANLDEFTSPATATVREILISVPVGTLGLNVFADEQARTIATTTVARLRNGEDFATVAAEVSDSPSKANGGLIGPLLVSEYSQPIQELIASLEVGDVADPIRTEQGYQILMLADRNDAVAQPFEEVRENIVNNVFNGRRQAEYAKFLETLREDAIIEWKSEELQQAYNAQLAADPIPGIAR